MMIFLAFLSVTVVTNTLLIWFAYKAFANFTSKVTETVTEFETNNSTRAWIATMQTAAEQAASVSEIAKRKMAEFDPVLGRAQEEFGSALAKMDTKLDEVAREISDGARKLRDVVAKPAFSVIAFFAGLSRAMGANED